MKFAEKLSLALTLLLAALLTVYTVWTQDRQFSADLQAAAAQARAAWEQERYAMQTTVKMNGAYAPPLTAPPAFADRQSRGDSKECCRPALLFRKGEFP